MPRPDCTCSVADDEELDLVIAIGYGEEKQGFKENKMAPTARNSRKLKRSSI